MLKFLGNLFWRSLGNEEAPDADPAPSQDKIDHEMVEFSGMDWSSGFVGYVLDNNTLWYSERHLAQELR